MITPRNTGDDCKCKLQIFSKFQDDDFIEIIRQISDSESKDMQDIYLHSLIESRETVRTRKLHTTINSESTPTQNKVVSKNVKKCSYIYSVKVRGSVHTFAKERLRLYMNKS